MTEVFAPGEQVPSSGIYRVYHDNHRLMHVATLPGGMLFPRCKQCGRSVRFELVRRVQDNLVISSRHHAILEECGEGETSKASGF
ncbi:MAG: hypothetical protein DMG65_13675 [Candidatus Angelobacter sp. Gp1-AA117]|nr:MAG: hypothetical protein DMG65_13675 [Candidatus Angelobacter sp. Gp1-AA117]